MNGTPIEKIRYAQQQFGSDIQTGDDIMDEQNMSDMDMLARDVGDSLVDPNEYQPQPQSKPVRLPKQKVIIKETQFGIMNKIPQSLREPIILIVIFLLLSTDTVKQILSTYIPQIKPTTTGSVAFIGILIYATIYAASFIVAKRLLL